jgi:hypothetical protein
LGFDPEPVADRDGKLSLWQIRGFTDEERRHFSKRSAAIDAEIQGLDPKKGGGGPDAGPGSHHARSHAAYNSRDRKGHEDVDRDLMPRWHAEWDRLTRPFAQAKETFAYIRMMALARHATPEQVLPVAERDRIVAGLLEDGSDLTRQKRWHRREVMVAAHHHLWGQPVDELDRLTGAVVTNREAVPLFPKPGATERAYSTATTIQREEHIRALVDRGMESYGAPTVSGRIVDRVIRAQEHQRGHRLTAGQDAMVRGMCASSARVSLVEGHAGTGKSTALDGVRASFEVAGYRVLGTATSGAAAQSLEKSARMTSSTVASLLWRADNGLLKPGLMDVIALDECGMTTDSDWERLLVLTEATGTRLIAVGDSRQLSPVGPGGVLRMPVTVTPARCTSSTRRSGSTPRVKPKHWRSCATGRWRPGRRGRGRTTGSRSAPPGTRC